LAPLAWLTAARARLVPPASRDGAILLEVACGGGLLGPHLAGMGYRHVGVDLSPTTLRTARNHGLSTVLRGDACALPIADETAEVVVAGEILEHVTDPALLIGECARVLRPGGTLVLDTIANTALARLLVVTLGEHLPGMLPRGIHDPALFIDREVLVADAGRCGITLNLSGLRPTRDVLACLLGSTRPVRMVPTRCTAVLFQGHGRKPSPATPLARAGTGRSAAR
jgi:2-polyprenyl-6-hydroxyphenyl methylase/3-demethylubiquinone-9 3-methyltransferase